MYRLFVVMLASLAVAGLGAVGLEAQVARAASDAAPRTETLDEGTASTAARFFRVEWTASPGRAGRTRITGYVYNDYGDEAVNVTLRVHQLDAGGRDGASVIVPVGDTIPALGRSYFDVRVPDSAGHRVDVASFSFVELLGL
jgi:hypothetical protein